MIVGLIVEKYDHKKVGLISVVGSYTGGSYNERGLYIIYADFHLNGFLNFFSQFNFCNFFGASK
jgi:hypothetical protein